MGSRRSKRISSRVNECASGSNQFKNYKVETRSMSKCRSSINVKEESDISNVSNVSGKTVVNANTTNLPNSKNVFSVKNVTNVSEPNIIDLHANEVLSDSEFEHDWISISSEDVKEEISKMDLLSHSEFEDDWISISSDEDIGKDIDLETLATYESVFEEEGGPSLSENISLLTSISDLLTPFIDLESMKDTASSSTANVKN